MTFKTFPIAYPFKFQASDILENHGHQFSRHEIKHINDTLSSINKPNYSSSTQNTLNYQLTHKTKPS